MATKANRWSNDWWKAGDELQFSALQVQATPVAPNQVAVSLQMLLSSTPQPLTMILLPSSA